MKAKDVRKGNIIMHKGEPYRVMDFNHHTPGNLRAMVQTKLRNLRNGTQTEVRYSSTENLEEASVFTYEASYLYKDASGAHFMNSESYEEVVITDAILGDCAYYLQEGMSINVMDYDGSPIGVTIPASVVLEVMETEPGIKGASATNVMKPAKTDTGLVVQVPPFVTAGDKILVNTADGAYLKKAN